MSGRRSRSKGQRGEREVCQQLALHGLDVRRGWQARSGQVEADVEGTELWWEVKRGKRCNPRAAYKQALGDTDGRVPVVAWRDDQAPWMVTLSLADFLALWLGRAESSSSDDHEAHEDR